MITTKEYNEYEHNHQELDQQEFKEVFDIQYEIGDSIFYFRLTKHIINFEQNNSIEFLIEDSDKLSDEILEKLKDKITNIYL